MNTTNKIKSVKLCLMAHPDNEKYSEFADRISDLEEIESNFSEMFNALSEAINLLYGTTEFEVIERYRAKINEFEQLLTKITE